MPFVAHDAAQWDYWHFPAWIGTIAAGMHILTVIIPAAFEGRTNLIEVRGKHLDQFEFLDNLCIGINKLLTAAFVYHCVRACWYMEELEWGIENIRVGNTVIPIVLFYVVYDFFYTLFHRALHLRSIYHLVHKHHHRQKAPSRGNLDAINVHPFEFVCGEYLHLATVWLVATKLRIPVHVLSAVVFVLAGGIFASLNHTRFDVSVLSSQIYTVKNHDVHHRLPESNYGQYIMLWDHVFGSYRPYTEKADAHLKSEKAQ